MRELKVKASRGEVWNYRNVNLYIFEELEGGRVGYCESITLKEFETDWRGPLSPTLSLSSNEAQMLMDSLWDCGLRPSEGSGSAGAMAAAQEHLKDMRRLVFHLLEVKYGVSTGP